MRSSELLRRPKLREVRRSDIHGKSVAVVGRSKSLEGSGEGPRIESRDLVLRVNTILPLQEESAPDIGSRTDIIFACTSCAILQRAKKAAAEHNAMWWQVDSGYRKRFGKAVRDFIPFSGTMALLQCLQFGAAEVYVSGMDLYTSGPNKLDNRKQQARAGTISMRVGFHSPSYEQDLLRALLDVEPKFVPWAPLREILESSEVPTHYKGATDAKVRPSDSETQEKLVKVAEDGANASPGGPGAPRKRRVTH